MKSSESADIPTRVGGRTSIGKLEVFPNGLSVEPVEFDADKGFRIPFSASRFTVAPGGATPPDAHAVAECWFVAAGDACLVYDSRTMRLQSGDIVAFAPNKTHQAFNDGDQELIVFSTWWEC